MKPHKHAELIKAWADGAKIQIRVEDQFEDANSDCLVWFEVYEYRIKPEPKLDYTIYYSIDEDGCWWRTYQTDNMKPNVAITFDGETGKPKSADVLK